MSKESRRQLIDEVEQTNAHSSPTGYKVAADRATLEVQSDIANELKRIADKLERIASKEAPKCKKSGKPKPKLKS